jgi:hypothetical protein
VVTTILIRLLSPLVEETKNMSGTESDKAKTAIHEGVESALAQKPKPGRALMSLWQSLV